MTMRITLTAEQRRLTGTQMGGAEWKQWGPYLSERAWGTVREDYSPDGSAWDYFPHDHARSRAYRWSEDGLAGICDDRQYLCFALALWNGRDPILKERLFGLSGTEGNHGEDVKEYYYYLDSTPSHSYMKMLYKYPQSAFPYAGLTETNRLRGRNAPEYELIDSGVFDEDRYFDVFVEYAKAGPADLLVRISAANRGPDPAELHLLPTLWFRNTWSWGDPDQPTVHPILRRAAAEAALAGAASAAAAPAVAVLADHPVLGRYLLISEGAPELLFTENDTNLRRLFGAQDFPGYAKDGINDCVVSGQSAAVNPAGFGTKAAAHYRLAVAPGETAVIRLRLKKLADAAPVASPDGRPPAATPDFDALFAQRQQEADAFYAALQPPSLSVDERLVQRQALAGMLWSKQFYHYDVQKWLNGDPAQPPPSPQRRHGRNSEWVHVNTDAILSMPDKWEYPWFAAWDLAFHCVALALVDLDFAKEQLILLGRVWYQHPNGQIPAYEWNFGDVNPPVQAWAAWRLYQMEEQARGRGDLEFLERVFHKLLLNFTWWVNRKDAGGRNVFQGGFLGLDNIGVFDRSARLPVGGHLEQSDGTAWMGMFCLNMLTIALELARHDRAYEDIGTKFFEHFLYIAFAMSNMRGDGVGLWDDEDEFFCDVLNQEHDGATQRLKVHSMVGLIPLFAVCTIESQVIENLPNFKRHMQWFLEHRPDMAGLVSRWNEPGMREQHLLALLRGHRMKRVLSRMLDESEFLSPYGVRALSRYHASHPYMVGLGGMNYEVDYQPAESNSALFGGNSNWRGPIWFPVNYLIIDALQGFHAYYGDDFKVECPTGSGQYLTLKQIAGELSARLTRIFLRDSAGGGALASDPGAPAAPADPTGPAVAAGRSGNGPLESHGRRPVFGGQPLFQRDPHWRDYILFHEYFHGDNGAGLGASHQTGWTGLIAELIQRQGEQRLDDLARAQTTPNRSPTPDPRDTPSPQPGSAP